MIIHMSHVPLSGFYNMGFKLSHPRLESFQFWRYNKFFQWILRKWFQEEKSLQGTYHRALQKGQGSRDEDRLQLCIHWKWSAKVFECSGGWQQCFENHCPDLHIRITLRMKLFGRAQMRLLQLISMTPSILKGWRRWFNMLPEVYLPKLILNSDFALPYWLFRISVLRMAKHLDK